MGWPHGLGIRGAGTIWQEGKGERSGRLGKKGTEPTLGSEMSGACENKGNLQKIMEEAPVSERRWELSGRRGGTEGRSCSDTEQLFPGDSVDIWSNEHEELDHIRGRTGHLGDDSGMSCCA